jgi:hypothetical protein
LYAAAAAGLKATYTTQLADGASVGPHVFSSSKSVGFVPVSVIEVSVSATAPLLVSVTACAADMVPCTVVGNVKLVVLSFTEGAAVPVPVRVTFCGEPSAPSAMLSVPVSAAADAGSNAT